MRTADWDVIYVIYAMIADTNRKILCIPKNQIIINMSSFPPRCYYCDSKDFGSVDGYERHVVTRHPNLPGYPGPADIKYYRLEKQDM